MVYLADDPLLNRQVAIKLPRLETLADDASRQCSVNESKIAAALDHGGDPNAADNAKPIPSKLPRP